MLALSARFPERITAIDELADRVQDGLLENLKGETPLYLYAFPREQSWWETLRGVRVEHTYFALTGQQVLLVHDLNGGLKVESLPVERLAYFEAGHSLLYSWLRFVLKAGTPEAILEYNSVFGEESRRAILSLRALTLRLDAGTPGITTGMSGEAILESLPLKFDHLSRKYWLAGESALSALFVPETRVKWLLRFTRVHSCRTAVILTNKQVLVMAEQGPEGSGAHHGAGYEFLPLFSIQSVGVARLERHSDIGALQLLVAGLQSPGAVSVPYPMDMEDEMRRFADDIDRVRITVVPVQEVA